MMGKSKIGKNKSETETQKEMKSSYKAYRKSYLKRGLPEEMELTIFDVERKK